MTTESISYNKSELRNIMKAFKALDEQAQVEAKTVSSKLAEYVQGKIKQAASGRRVSTIAAQRIADGSRVSKSSKVGELSIGFASQKFSGGGTTQQLWGGMEFGSNRFKQFPNRTPSKGKGNLGYFIYPTLRAEQPEIIRQWEDAFDRILKEW
jgi:hypothetical protein